MRKYIILSPEFPQIDLKANKVAIVRSPQPLDEFTTESRITPDGEVIFCCSDIRIFFNQQRLSQLSQKVIDDMVGAVRKSPIDTSKYTDEQLISSLKSRYIQSQADVYQYTRYLQSNIDDEVTRITSEIEAQRQASDKSDSSGDEPPAAE